MLVAVYGLSVPIVTDALREGSYAGKIGATDVFIHLIGTPPPSPAKAARVGHVLTIYYM